MQRYGSVTGLSLLWQRFRYTQLFLHVHNKTPSVAAMGVSNLDCSARVHGFALESFLIAGWQMSRRIFNASVAPNEASLRVPRVCLVASSASAFPRA